MTKPLFLALLLILAAFVLMAQASAEEKREPLEGHNLNARGYGTAKPREKREPRDNGNYRPSPTSSRPGGRPGTLSTGGAVFGSIKGGPGGSKGGGGVKGSSSWGR